MISSKRVWWLAGLTVPFAVGVFVWNVGGLAEGPPGLSVDVRGQAPVSTTTTFDDRIPQGIPMPIAGPEELDGPLDTRVYEELPPDAGGGFLNPDFVPLPDQGPLPSMYYPECKWPDANGWVECPHKPLVIPGLLSSTTTTIQNADPVCSGVVASPSVLWPPNHQMVTVGFSGFSDPDGDQLRVRINSVRSDEPVTGLGSGDTTPDALLSGDGTVSLRSERAGAGNGRVYTVAYEVTDSKGGSCTGTATIGVPKSKGKKAVDNRFSVNARG